MVQRKLGLQADQPKPSSYSSSSHNLQEPNFKKKIKKSRSMKLSNIETPKSSSSSQRHDSNSKSSSKLPNYMKSTNSSDARKQQQQEQPQVSAQTQICKKRHGSGSCNKEPRTRTLTRSSSLRSVRALVKTHSFKHARAPPSKEIDIERATCSSTLKNSRFPGFLELNHGGTEAQGTSAMRVCPYLYCSLNGHHHNNPSPPLKMFLKAKRRSLKTQRSIKKTNQDIEVYVKNKDGGHGHVVEISLSEGSPESEVDYEEVIEGLAREGAKIGGFCFESDCEDEPKVAISESSGMEWCEVDEEVMSSDQIEDIDDLKLGFSLETENLEIQELDYPVEEVLQEQEVIEDEGHCFDDTELVAMLVTSPEIEDLNLLKIGFLEETENLETQELDGLVQEVLQEQDVIENEDQSFDDTESSTMLVISPEIEFINHLKDRFSPESENGELRTMSKVDVLVQEVLQEQEVIEDEPEENGASEVDALVKDGHELMYSDQIEDISDLKLGVSQETENLEIQELDAMVEQVLQEQEVMEEDEIQPSDSAMEPKPEIEGNGVSEAHTQLKDGESNAPVQKAVSEVTDEVTGSNPHAESIAVQKVVSEVTDEAIGSNPHSEAHTQLKDGESNAPVQKVASEVTDEVSIADHNANSEPKGGFVPKPRKSQEMTLEDDLDTKWRIGSRRVLQEVEEDTSFNPREPNYLPDAPDQESEKIDLKHQLMDERRSDNEWMLDYVLQQTVTKLAPARKRKVALLVEAFESVLPIPRYNEPPTRAVFAHSRPIQACN